MEPLIANIPLDVAQIPDIIINVYSDKTFSGEYRVGYLRIPAKDCMRSNPKPQWYRLRSPYNEKTCPGIILLNIQCVRDTNNERFPKLRGAEGPCKFFAQILSGFEIAPNVGAD